MRSSMVPAVRLLRNWNVLEASSGLFFGAIYPVRWISIHLATLKNGHCMFIQEKTKHTIYRSYFIRLFPVLLALISQICAINIFL